MQVDRYLYAKIPMSEPRIIESPWPHVEIPMVSLQKFLLQKLSKYCDQHFIECETNSIFTFEQFADDSLRMANAWKALGLKEGQIFGVAGYNCYEYLVIYFGGIIAGGIAMGIRSFDTFQKVSDKLIQRKVKYLAITNKNIEIAQKISDGIPITEKIILFNGGNKLNDKFQLYTELIEMHAPMSDDQISLPKDVKDDICIIVGTSGSVGLPKPVKYSHFNIVAGLIITSQQGMFGYTTIDTISAHSQLFHYSAVFLIFSGITNGSRIALMPQFDYDDFINYVQHYKITVAMLPPSVITSMVKDPEMHDIPSLTKLICRGNFLSKSIGQKFVERYTHIKDFRQGLFQTESVGPITLNLKGSKEYNCVGVPIPNSKVKIIDPETDEILGPNQHGEICVHKGDGFFKGYYNNDDATKKLIDMEGWIHTGDGGHYDNDGYIYAVERFDAMIKSAGVLISPSELEELLLSHSAVREAAVTAIPTLDEHEEPTSFVILNPAFRGKISGHDIETYVNGIIDRTNLNTIKYIRDNSHLIFVLDQLPKRRRLHGVHIVESFPRTSLGKVIKRQLRDDLLFSMVQRKF